MWINRNTKLTHSKLRFRPLTITYYWWFTPRQIIFQQMKIFPKKYLKIQNRWNEMEQETEETQEKRIIETENKIEG